MTIIIYYILFKHIDHGAMMRDERYPKTSTGFIASEISRCGA